MMNVFVFSQRRTELLSVENRILFQLQLTNGLPLHDELSVSQKEVHILVSRGFTKTDTLGMVIILHLSVLIAIKLWCFTSGILFSHVSHFVSYALLEGLPRKDTSLCITSGFPYGIPTF